MNPSMNSAEIEAAAAAWFAKRESDDWHAADQAQLDAWLDSSTAHRIAFIRIVTTWERFGRLKALGAGVPAGTIPPRGALELCASFKGVGFQGWFLRSVLGGNAAYPELGVVPSTDTIPDVRAMSLGIPAIPALSSVLSTPARNRCTAGRWRRGRQRLVLINGLFKLVSHENWWHHHDPALRWLQGNAQHR